jgi:large subunit ribosomal protein L28
LFQISISAGEEQMARRCELTGKGVQTGHNVSHSNIKSNRRFLPSVRRVKLVSDALNRVVALKISTHALRSVEHNQGIDNFIVKQSDAKLSLNARRLKRDILKARASHGAAADLTLPAEVDAEAMEDASS